VLQVTPLKEHHFGSCSISVYADGALVVHDVAPPVRSFAVVIDLLYQLDDRRCNENEDTI
jgi:hypothetical protein